MVTSNPKAPYHSMYLGAPIATPCSIRSKSRITKDEQQRFPPICPDFVIELRYSAGVATRTQTDALDKLRAKMREYQENGASLGWLIDPLTPLVEIYRSGQDVEVVNFSFDHPPLLSGEEVLPGFVLDLSIIFNP